MQFPPYPACSGVLNVTRLDLEQTIARFLAGLLIVRLIREYQIGTNDWRLEQKDK